MKYSASIKTTLALAGFVAFGSTFPTVSVAKEYDLCRLETVPEYIRARITRRADYAELLERMFVSCPDAALELTEAATAAVDGNSDDQVDRGDDNGPGGGTPGGPDNGGPDNGGPDNGGPDNGGPDNGGPDNGGPDNGGPDNGGPDNGGPDNGGPDNGGPDNGGPDNGGPDNGGPDNGGPDNGGPDNGGPNNGDFLG